jgi:hypothetical protein
MRLAAACQLHSRKAETLQRHAHAQRLQAVLQQERRRSATLRSELKAARAQVTQLTWDVQDRVTTIIDCKDALGQAGESAHKRGVRGALHAVRKGLRGCALNVQTVLSAMASMIGLGAASMCGETVRLAHCLAISTHQSSSQNARTSSKRCNKAGLLCLSCAGVAEAASAQADDGAHLPL